MRLFKRVFLVPISIVIILLMANILADSQGSWQAKCEKEYWEKKRIAMEIMRSMEFERDSVKMTAADAKSTP